MASLIVSYYGGVHRNCAKDPVASEVVTTSASSAQGAVQTAAAVVSFYSDVPHYVNTGTNPTASATQGGYAPAGQVLWLAIGAGQRIAAITA